MPFHAEPVDVRVGRVCFSRIVAIAAAMTVGAVGGSIAMAGTTLPAVESADWRPAVFHVQPESKPQPKPAGKPAAKKGVLAVPDGIALTRDVEYAEVNGRKLLLDIYLPEKPAAEKPVQVPVPAAPSDGVKGKSASVTPTSLKVGEVEGAGRSASAAQGEVDPPLPVIIWIHGGGWESGTKDASPAARLVPFGYAAISISYRFSQVAPYPAQIHDCKAAVRWVRAHAKEYNFDPDHIGVWGASAGGHLVALLGTSAGEKELEGDVGGNLDQSSAVQAVCDWFGPTDFIKLCRMASGEDVDEATQPRPDLPVPLRTKSGKPGVIVEAAPAERASDTKDKPRTFPKLITPGLIRKLFGGQIQDKLELAVLANPITFVDKSDAPVLIMHGDRDSLVPLDQSTLLKVALEQVGVKVTLHVVKDGGHGFWTEELLDTVRRFFDENLKAKQVGKPGEAIELKKPVTR